MRKLVFATLCPALIALGGDPFIGTWKANLECTKRANPSLNLDAVLGSAAMGETIRIESHLAGLKLTLSLGDWSSSFTTDFRGGETNVADSSGKIVDRVRLVRKGANEIEAVSLQKSGHTVWRVSPDGRSLQLELDAASKHKLVGCYDRAK